MFFPMRLPLLAVLLLTQIIILSAAETPLAPEAKSAPLDPVRWLLLHREKWPQEVTLKRETLFPIIIGGKSSGLVTMKPGSKVTLLSFDDAHVVVLMGDSSVSIALNDTDLAGKARISMGSATPPQQTPSPAINHTASPTPALSSPPPRNPRKEDQSSRPVNISFQGGVTTDAQAIAALNLDAPGMEKVKTAVQSGDLTLIQKAYLDYRRTSNPAKWNVMPSEEPAATATADAIGDKICNHLILTGGYVPDEFFDMGKDFDWALNPRPREDPGFSEEWTFGPVARTPFWQKLAYAYWRTHNEKYATAWVEQLADFAVKNPLSNDGKDGRSKRWRTLDSAIRMHDSWPYAYNHFLNSPSFTPAANWLYLRMVLDHASLLVGFLKSHPDSSGNWVSTECFGVYTMGTFFPELKEAQGWCDLAIDRMTKELTRMVPPDGFEVELTPGYHMVSARGFKGPLELAKINGRSVPELFKEKIMSMFRALVTVMDQSGHVVSTNDTGHLSAIDAARDGLKLDDDPLLQWAVSRGKSGKGLADSTRLPYAGFYTLRSGWKPDDLFLFFRAGPVGYGHQHQDMLQVILKAWNTPLLIDPGSYTYDHSQWRWLVLNTPAYSTVMVDGKCQYRKASPAPVEKPANNPWITTPLFDFVAGTYDGGYQESHYGGAAKLQVWTGEPDHSVTHTRRVLYLRPFCVLILDTLDGTGSHTFDAHFQLDALSAHLDQNTQAAFSDNQGPVQLALYPIQKEHLAVDIVQGQKDPFLGWYAAAHKAIPTVRFRKVQEAPAIFATLLYPYKGSTPPAFTSTPLVTSGKDIWAWSLTTPEEKAEVVIVKDGTSRAISIQSALLGSVSAISSGLVIRQPAGKKDLFFGGWGISSYADANTAFSTDTPANIVVVPQANLLRLFNGGEKEVVLTLTKPFAQTAHIAPGTWTDISAKEAKVSPSAPTLFRPFTAAP